MLDNMVVKTWFPVQHTQLLTLFLNQVWKPIVLFNLSLCLYYSIGGVMTASLFQYILCLYGHFISQFVLFRIKKQTVPSLRKAWPYALLTSGSSSSMQLYKIYRNKIQFFIYKKKFGRTRIAPEVLRKTSARKKENESNLDVCVEKREERTFVCCLI